MCISISKSVKLMHKYFPQTNIFLAFFRFRI